MKKAKNGKPFDVLSLKVETDIPLSPRSEGTTEMYNKLSELQVGNSLRMPRTIQKLFINAKVTHKRVTKRVFVYRNIDKYNFRVWRVGDDTVLRRMATKRKK